MNKLMWQSLI